MLSPACNLSHCSNSARRRNSTSSILAVFQVYWQRSSIAAVATCPASSPVTAAAADRCGRQAREVPHDTFSLCVRVWASALVLFCQKVRSPPLAQTAIQHRSTHSWAAEYPPLPRSSADVWRSY